MALYLFLILQCLCLLLSTALAFPSFPAFSPSSINDEEILPTRNEGNWTASPGTTDLALELRDATFFNCDGPKYRSNLNPISCQDAVAQIPTSAGHQRFSLRGIGQYEIGLPFRYISFDGRCTIDLLLKDGYSSERASMLEISGAARSLLNRCVRAQKVGGIAMEVGESGNLGVIMTSYQPMVKCYVSPAPPLGNCKRLADTMMTSSQRKTFGPPIDPSAYVKLPKNLYDDGQQCKAVIRTSDITDVSTFYEVWEAVVAITGMCIRFGHTGTAFLRGEKKKLYISLVQNYRSVDET